VSKRILLIQGHPDPDRRHFGYALSAAYAEGARRSGHEVVEIDVASIDFPLMRTADEFFDGEPPASIAQCQQSISQAQHVVFFYPLWLGDMPALLKAFLEQIFRPHFCGKKVKLGPFTHMLRGKSARVVVTMGMPGVVYRLFYRSHSLLSFERSILGFVGFSPVRHTIVGSVEQGGARRQARRLRKMELLGRRAR
jgi:putative NADPH-quinone reductase